MKNLVFLVLISFTFIQCGNESAATGQPSASEASSNEIESLPPGDRTEIGNFEFWHHIKNEGVKPVPGQVVFYSYEITKGGKLVQGNYGENPSGGILPTEEEAKNNPQAIGEALRRMAVGDSVTIIYPQGETPDSNLVYNIVLRAIYNR